MSFKFNKKALVTGLSCVEADKRIVYAQTIKRISSQNAVLVDGNIFCVDIGAAALKKQSKTEKGWLPEEVENAGIIPGTIITVTSKERYVKTEVCIFINFSISVTKPQNQNKVKLTGFQLKVIRNFDMLLFFICFM